MSGRYPSLAVDNTNNVTSTQQINENNPEVSDVDAKKIATQTRPRGMSKAEQQIWNTDIPEYIKINRFQKHFVRFFKDYCIVVARMEATKSYLDSEGIGWTYTTVGRNGAQHKSRPEVAQYNDDWRKLNGIYAQIGGSPATDHRFKNLKQGELFEDLY